MKAEYNHWYKCQEGQMPEDFENVLDFPHEDRTKEILVIDKDLGYYVEKRVIPPYNNLWAWDIDWTNDYDAWMLPEPYKEEGV